ncbi:DEAD/DEAH box helicase [Flaviaesturariibacter aridisoli]|uniref:DEAD/DEAH box helicase n=1 Tax=Flaviaesturariibacter aridisoli TaxID=2545761 RepID=A0A4R4E460_9BACT|nr:DEAD/DEAH box helicase [Flaviaesturariibacter aridisoli]TCZ73727.1 DEAD/DEAH box helicase [Flaviaesturariibacter aridisoli]
MPAPLDIPALLANLNIKTLNPMQEAALAAAQEHDNLVLLAPTGSGKTLAFLLPLLANLEPGVSTQAIIVTPSRELALQIEEVWRKLKTNRKVLATYGGHKREIEETSISGEAPVLIVGTPGRLADHLRRGNINKETVRTLVLDEFDKSVELGFQDELEEVLGHLPHIKKRILTSATSAEIPDFVGATDAHVLQFQPETTETDNPEEGIVTGAKLTLQALRASEKDKLDTLFRYLCLLGRGPAIIFLNHRESVERTANYLREAGVATGWYHGALEQREREVALARFRNGSDPFLVTTDLAARGLDIPHIRAVVHYHIPNTESEFTHRNGRTARADASGTAVLILSPGEEVPDYIKEPVEFIELPEDLQLPEKPRWATLYISAGKKDKVNKIDIVGFLSKVGGLKPEDIGLIEVKDYMAFAAVRRSQASRVLAEVKDQKLKGKKIKIDMAR